MKINNIKSSTANKIYTKRNKVRTTLLIIANKEMNTYLKNSCMLLNSESPKVIADKQKVYDGITIVDFIICDSHHDQTYINKYGNNQIITNELFQEENIDLERIFNTIPDKQTLDKLERIRHKLVFHRKTLDPSELHKDLHKISASRSSTSGELITTRQISKSQLVRFSASHKYLDNLLIMKNIYSKPRLSRKIKLEFGIQILSKTEKNEIDIQNNIEKLKLYVYKLKKRSIEFDPANITEFNSNNNFIIDNNDESFRKRSDISGSEEERDSIGLGNTSGVVNTRILIKTNNSNNINNINNINIINKQGIDVDEETIHFSYYTHSSLNPINTSRSNKENRVSFYPITEIAEEVEIKPSYESSQTREECKKSLLKKQTHLKKHTEIVTINKDCVENSKDCNENSKDNNKECIFNNTDCIESKESQKEISPIGLNTRYNNSDMFDISKFKSKKDNKDNNEYENISLGFFDPKESKKSSIIDTKQEKLGNFNNSINKRHSCSKRHSSSYWNNSRKSSLLTENDLPRNSKKVKFISTSIRSSGSFSFWNDSRKSSINESKRISNVKIIDHDDETSIKSNDDIHDIYFFINNSVISHDLSIEGID